MATEPLPYHAADNVSFGVDWNQGPTPGFRSFSGFVIDELHVPLEVGMEVPYANERDIDVTADKLRQFGRQLAAALARYLQA